MIIYMIISALFQLRKISFKRYSKRFLRNAVESGLNRAPKHTLEANQQ